MTGTPRPGPPRVADALGQLTAPSLGVPPGILCGHVSSGIWQDLEDAVRLLTQQPPSRPPGPPHGRKIADDAESLTAVSHDRSHVVHAVPVYHLAALTSDSVVRVRQGVLDRLHLAASHLPERFSLVVLDGWRPHSLQQLLFERAYGPAAPTTLPPGFVTDPAQSSPPHLTGAAVDVTLAFDTVPLGLGTGFDEFSTAAHLTAFDAVPGPVRTLRQMLTGVLSDAGFSPLWCEWWHFTCTASGPGGYGPLGQP